MLQIAIALGMPAAAVAGTAEPVEQRLEHLEREVNQLQQQSGTEPIDTAFGVVLKFAGYLQADGLTTFHRDPSADQFHIRRARFIVQGYLGDIAQFVFAPELTKSTLYDAYIDLAVAGHGALRVGKFKVPFGLEMLQSATALIMAERALTYDLVPDRDIGMALHGAAGPVLLSLGVLNGVRDGGIDEGDSNDSKSVTARAFAKPFHDGVLSGLGFGVAGTWSAQGEAVLPSYHTSIARTQFFTYRRDVTSAGRHSRIAPQASYFHGPFGGIAEYVRSSQVLSRAGRSVMVGDAAWQATASWVITGEDATYQGVTPAHPVSAGDWSAGAVQLALRYTAFSVDPAVFAGGAASLADPATNARGVREVTAGVNWYLQDHLRALFDVSRAAFSCGGPPEWAALARLQATY